MASGSLPSKKLKTVSSLVQKWQQVKQKADEEMMEESSEDEDPERAALKRIEEWKRAQIDRCVEFQAALELAVLVEWLTFK